MKTLNADFKIVTPLFMSGSDQTVAEIRPPSLKAIIRFWWRAMAYARYDGDLKKLSEREEELFGSTKRVASISVRIPSHEYSMTQKGSTHPQLKLLPGARYLGYGLMEAFDGENTTAGKLQRPCISHNQHLLVTFIAKDEIPEDFIDAVKLVGLVGGMGSRSRKGFGSLSLCSLTLDGSNRWTKPASLDAYRENLGSLLGDKDKITTEPPFSAFSQLTRIDYLSQGNDPNKLLDDFGRQMQRYRSWGKNNKVNQEASEQNFKEDHDWFKRLGNYRNQDFHPKRIIFGLPHNYGKYEKDNVTGDDHDRRASPLFVHVYECAPNDYRLISIILRAEFLPKGELIKAGEHQVTQHIEWEKLDDFLDGKVGPKGQKTSTPYFPNKQTWFGGRAK